MARLILISFEQNIEEKKLEVEFICAKDSMMVSADKDSIHQVLYNLCENAIKFANVGGVFRIQIKPSTDGKLCVSVYNQGQGISSEDLPYVFERFYKSDKSRGLDKKGVGLGLYIVKTILEAQNQTVTVASQAGEWCEFKFTLQMNEE
jgi:signal transduction histidine kinase